MKPWTAIALAAGVGLGGTSESLAQALGKTEYQAARKTIESDFRSAKTGCEPMHGNVRIVCIADVRGRESIALAELRAAYDPTSDSMVDVRIAKARAALELSRARCDDLPVQRKPACTADAGAAHGAALAPPKAVPSK